MARGPEAIAKTESLFRGVNEKIATAADQFGSEETEFVGECADPTRVERLEVPLEVYEGVRAEPTTFILANGHEDKAIETVVQERRRYQIVEKVNRKVVEVVDKLEPRGCEPDLKPG